MPVERYSEGLLKQELQAMNLNQVTIYSDKTVETVEFFQKLGLKLIVDSLPRYARLECPDGDATLSVNIADPVTPVNSIVLYFECGLLNAEVERLKSIGLHSTKNHPTAPGSGGRPI